MLSWSQKLFLKINSLVGKNKFRDDFFYFCGQWLIFVLAVIDGLFFLYRFNTYNLILFIDLSLIAFVSAFGMSYIIALWTRHPRPIVEYPYIKELIKPLSTWKSFPSDHTIGAILLAVIGFILSGGFWWSLFIFVVLALLVMSGRVYCGVHYPRDIVGGIVVSIIAISITLLIYLAGSANIIL